MACSGCRKPAAVVPQTINYQRSNVVPQPTNSTFNGAVNRPVTQRERIQGLTYVIPKK